MRTIMDFLFIFWLVFGFTSKMIEIYWLWAFLSFHLTNL
jgi:hypothetical protein